MFDRLEIVPAYKTVCEAIEKQIMSGRLGPGDQLPTETDLAAQFGLTRHTIREGLRILEEGGLVGREAGRRLVVKQPHYTELAPRALRAYIMQKVTFQELWEVSMSLEPCAAAGAARHVTAGQIERLEDNLLQTERADENGLSVIPLDVEFHNLVAEISGNRVLLLAREPVSQLFYPALAKLFAHPRNRGIGPRRLIEAHRQIISALKAGDGVEAEIWMRRHLADFRRGYDVCGFSLDEQIGFDHTAGNSQK
jgi:DNA-binding FadR family transcriptional regulator